MLAISERLKELDITDVPKFPLSGVTTVGRVFKVCDGDTCDVVILVRDHPEYHRLRLLGFDSPEVHTKDLEEKAHGLACKGVLEHLVLGKIIKIVFAENDLYGRALSNIFVSGSEEKTHHWDGESELDVNRYMIESTSSCKYEGGKKGKEFNYLIKGKLYSEKLIQAQKELKDPKKKGVAKHKKDEEEEWLKPL